MTRSLYKTLILGSWLPDYEGLRVYLLALRTSNFQGATIRLTVPRKKCSTVVVVLTFLLYKSHCNWHSQISAQQIICNGLSTKTLKMNWKKLQNFFCGHVLSVWAFSPDGQSLHEHYHILFFTTTNANKVVLNN